ncbi:MAG: hypothetical protein ACRDWY_17740 [Actinomycetes bacterium]
MLGRSLRLARIAATASHGTTMSTVVPYRTRRPELVTRWGWTRRLASSPTIQVRPQHLKARLMICAVCHGSSTCRTGISTADTTMNTQNTGVTASA